MTYAYRSRLGYPLDRQRVEWYGMAECHQLDMYERQALEGDGLAFRLAAAITCHTIAKAKAR